MADVRHFQYLEQIRDSLGFPVGFSGLTASTASAVAGQLALLNTTASHIDGRLAGTRIAHPRANEIFWVQVVNPAAGNNTLQSAPIGSNANILYKIRMNFIASHQTAKAISFRDGTSGTTYMTAMVPNGVFNWDINLPTPWSQTAAQAAVCFVASGFSALGTYEALINQQVPGTI